MTDAKHKFEVTITQKSNVESLGNVFGDFTVDGGDDISGGAIAFVRRGEAAIEVEAKQAFSDADGVHCFSLVTRVGQGTRSTYLIQGVAFKY